VVAGRRPEDRSAVDSNRLYAGWTSGSRGHRDHERRSAPVALVITVSSRSRPRGARPAPNGAGGHPASVIPVVFVLKTRRSQV